MKMTDESALDVLNRLVQDLGSITEDDAIGLQNYLRARLAADQQKGGGESDDTVFIQQTRCYPGDEWFREMTVEGVQFLVPLDQQEQARFILSAKKRRTTPQPSIPAPAQQGDQLDAARWRKLEELVDTGSDRYWYVHPSDGEGGSYDRMKSASHLRQCIDRELAHPPHADQEKQG